MTSYKVPIFDLDFGEEEIDAVTAALKSGWISQGPLVARFESQFAEFLGAKHAIAVSSCTAALHLACMVLDLQPGDEVICPALTFVATANAIRYTGAKPCFADITGPHDLNISPDDVAQKVNPRTKALLVVHYGGYPVDMAAMQKIAARHGLAIIEDCAHAPGAIYVSPPGNQKVGTLGTLSCFSFFSNKNMTTAEGGMAVTNDGQLAERLRVGRSHGMTTLSWDRYRGHGFTYDVVAPGYNYRMDEMRAALGIVQLSRLEGINSRRRELTLYYHEHLKQFANLLVPFEKKLAGSSCHILPVLLPPASDRAGLMAALAAKGIQTSIHYPPVTSFSYYQQLWPQGYDHHIPQTEDVAARELTLPLFPALTEAQIDQVIMGLENL